MLNVLVVCLDKASYDSAKITDKVKYINVMNKHLKNLSELGCCINYVAHDDVAIELLNNLGIDNKRCINVVPEIERVCSEKFFYEDEIIPKDLLNRISESVEVKTSRYKLVKATEFKNKDEYLAERKKALKYNVKVATDEYVKSKDIVLYFGDSNLCWDPTHSNFAGDGKTIISVNVKTGIINNYYGGMWVDNDTMKSILEAEINNGK